MSIWQVRDEMNVTSENPVAELLRSRGHDYESFLNPTFSQLHSPMLMKDMDRAVKRTIEAIKKGEKIRIAGDYDADGISSTTVMMTLLQEAGADVSYQIPNRSDGYGLSNKMIDHAYQSGCALVITCDNGIACIDQVEYAKGLGIDVIITDHHEPQERIPDTIVIDPKRHDCPYPFKHLAGVGVAWKFCQAVLETIQPGGRIKSLDVIEIVATGTVADVVDLVGENRVIVSHGLKRFSNTSNVGMQALLKALELDDKEISAHHIGFTIGPALNATGRLVSADEAVDMFLQKSPLKAARSAKYLAELNKERKEWTDKYANEIIQEVEKLGDATPSIIVHHHPEIPEGIVGIVASRLKEKFNRPVLLMTTDESGKNYKGSGRSIPEYNLFENLMPHKHLFVGVGGHAMACGFTLPKQNLDKLIKVLTNTCELTEDDMTPKLMIDYDVDPELVTMKLAEEMEQMKPFGKGNPKPLFCMGHMKVISHKFIGQEKTHLKLEIASGEEVFECIGFGMADQFRAMDDYVNSEKGNTEPLWIDVAFYPGINEWNGRRTLQLELQDIRLSE